MFGGFQVGPFQPIPAYQQVSASVETGSVEWPPRARKKRRIYEEPPSAVQIQAERERLGILPAKTRQAVLKVVRESSNVSDETQAAILAAAYFEPVQLDRLVDRLQASFQAKKETWNAETLGIAQALIFEALRKKADADLLAGILAEMRLEEDEAADLFTVMFLLDD